MDHLNFKITPLVKDQTDPKPETLRLTKNGIKGWLRNFTGMQGEHFVSIIPSLNVSGYGFTESEAIESLKDNLHTFFSDLFALTEVQRRKEISTMGWEVNTIFNKPRRMAS